ncbi:hypothetical protein L798_05576 [Zootermopsis nevadensis]|uniref:Uncharacterized protein n=1 Tax=Zootermopsis nevadensis TaxID=136037 RepID=A0A067RBA7_ZOONE|nr:hypothetical protein L798_05576 [Zootermopsis nevadensis]
MALLTKGLVFIIVVAIADYCCSQNAVTPLWPCYSVFKIQLANPASPLSSVYRYTSKFVTRNEDEAQYPDHPGLLEILNSIFICCELECIL